MKRILGAFLLLFVIQVFSYGQIKKVQIEFKQEEVFVVLDDKLVGENPQIVKINFDLNKNVYFYKKGYYSQRVEIEPDVPFAKLTVDLIKKDKSTMLPNKKLLKPDTLLVSKIVTNFTKNDLKEIIESNFVENNFLIGSDIKLFAGAENEIHNTKYKIGIEIVDSKQIRSVYKAPRFMMAQIIIRWYLYDIEQNKVVYFDSTEGSYFIKLQKPKGFVVTEIMERVMEGAIDESQGKLLSDKKFRDLILAD
jgi:hypothetical protein